MMKSIYFLVVFAGLITGTGCKKDKSPVIPDIITGLRIFNSTPYTFHDCTIDPKGTLSDNAGPGAYNFGQVDVNTKTSYKTFTNLYRYSWVRLVMNNKPYYLKPYDYTGESPLVRGQYAYKLTYSSANDQLNLELIKE
jgi:hypothetical protein